MLTLSLKFSAYFKNAQVKISNNVALSSPKVFSTSVSNSIKSSSLISLSSKMYLSVYDSRWGEV